MFEASEASRDVRVVHEDVDGAELAYGASNRCLDVVVVHHVRRLEDRLPAEFVGDLGRHCRTGLGIELGHDHGCTFTSEPPRDRASHAMAGADDDRDPTVESTHSSPYPTNAPSAQ